MDKILLLRLFTHVEIRSNEECWPWKGKKTTSGGYGWTRLGGNGKEMRVHRVIYMAYHGVRLDSDTVVRHDCDNPICCNPLHLKSGTQADNVRDREMRGRSRLHGSGGKRKLTEVQVRKIHKDTRSLEEIAKEYKVTTACIYDVKRGRSWRRVAIELGITPIPSAYGLERAKISG